MCVFVFFLALLRYNCDIYVRFYQVFCFKDLFVYLAVLGLCCCMQAVSTCRERGLLCVVVCGLLIVVASLAAEPRL